MTTFMADGTEYRATLYHAYPLPPERDRYIPPINQRGYKLPHPLTGRVETFTRATTISHTLDDGFGLEKWKMRNLLTGTALRLDQHAHLVGRVSQSGVELEAKELDQMAEAFQVAAGGAEAREFGTAVHAWAEAVDFGHVLPAHVPDMFRPYVMAYLTGMNRNCLVPIRSLTERIVYNPEANCVGTLDRIFSLPDQTTCLGDVKTSKTLDYGYLDFAIQLAIYAGASHMWDPDKLEWVPFPEIRQDFAVVMHIPSNNPGAAVAVTFDLDAGRAALATALEVRAMRSGAKAFIPNKHALPAPSAEHRRKHDAMTGIHQATSLDDLSRIWEEYQDVWTPLLDQLSQTVAARLLKEGV